MRADRWRRIVGFLLPAAAVLLVVALASAALILPAGAQEDPDQEPAGHGVVLETEPPVTEPPVTPPAGVEQVSSAVLRWGMSNEANSRAQNGGVNGFSAGRVRDPGRGGIPLRERDWSQTSGAVRIEKFVGSGGSGRWRPATWAGLSTSSTGAGLAAGVYSNHEVVLGGGTGTVDRAAGTARITWRGSFTVFFYTGELFFYVADPELDVANGRGTLTASVSGFATTRIPPITWSPVSSRRVTLADLSGVDLDDARGLSVTPDYLGVVLTGTSQRTDVPAAGGFPQSFVDFLEVVGAGPFWYSTGSSLDASKAALPLSVSYRAGDAVTTPTPPAEPKPPKVRNRVKNPPSPSADPAPTAPPVPPVPSVGAPPTAPPAALVAPLAAPVAPVVASAVGGGPEPRAPAEFVAVSAPAAEPRSSATGWWLLGAGLLLLAALTLLVPARATVRAAPPSSP